MPYNAWVTAAGQCALEQLRTEARLRLATTLLLRVRATTYNGRPCLDVASLGVASLDELLGEFWAWYGWEARRQLARAPDVDKAFTHIVLRSASHPLTPLDAEGRYLALDLAAHQTALRPYEQRRQALAKQQREKLPLATTPACDSARPP